MRPNSPGLAFSPLSRTTSTASDKIKLYFFVLMILSNIANDAYVGIQGGEIHRNVVGDLGHCPIQHNSQQWDARFPFATSCPVREPEISGQSFCHYGQF